MVNIVGLYFEFIFVINIVGLIMVEESESVEFRFLKRMLIIGYRGYKRELSKR